MNEEALFHQALALPVAERAVFVNSACGGDDALRQRLEVLLQAHANPGSFLQSPAVTVDAPSMEAPGMVIGPYRLMEQIGEGGMGLVFVAEQQQPVRRKVALKVIKPGMDTRQVVARFEAERQALALMDHPNIAKVLDGGETAGGRPYFVMELVKGAPLTKYCDEQRLTPRQRLELFVPVCQAVQHAHQKGIIHRDIKPSNVLIAQYDGKPVPKVIDFGIAKATGQQLSEHTLITGFGAVVGTLEYMSPEQAELNQLDIDTRSDIYSLGVLLYELLTGTTPLEKKRLKEVALLELLRVIREEEPPRPSTRLSTTDELPSVAANRGLEPKKLSGLVRGEVDWMVMKALEKDRNRRYESANGFALDVQRYLKDEPVQACPPSSWYRFRKFARRNRTRLAASVSVFLGVTILAATIGWAVWDRAAREAHLQQSELARRSQVERRALEDLTAARTLLRENKLPAARRKLAEARAQLGDDRAALSELATEIEVAEATLDRFEQFLDLIERAHQAETAPLFESAPAADGSDSRAGKRPSLRMADRQPAKAVPFLLKALARYEILERESATLAQGLLGSDQLDHIHRLAYEELLLLAKDVADRQQEHRSGRKLSSQEAAREALVYLDKAESAHRPTKSLHVLRAMCRGILDDVAAAKAEVPRARATPPTLAVDHYLRGLWACNRGQFAEGAKAFRAALDLEPTHYWSMMWLGHCLQRSQRREDKVAAVLVYTGCLLKRPEHAHAYFSRANAYLSLGRNQDALADYSRAIARDPNHVGAWINRSLTLARLNQVDKAFTGLAKAIQLDPDNAEAWANRGYLYSETGKPARAVDDYSEALKLDPKYMRFWSNRGNAYLNLHQFDKARDDYTEALKLDEKYVPALSSRGTAYRMMGKLTEALADYTRAIKLDEKHAIAWNGRGNVYSDLGEHARAVDDYSRAIALNPEEAKGWVNRGASYRKLRQYPKAVADYTKAIDLNPKWADAWSRRGVAHCQMNKLDEAVADFTEAINLDPKHAGAWSGRGQANLLRGELDKAVADFSEAIRLNETSANAWANRAVAYLRLGKLEQARDDCSRAIKLDEKDALKWNNRAYVNLRLGKLEEGIADYTMFLKLAPNHPQAVEAYLPRGQAYYRLGRYTEAREDYEAAVKRAPAHAEAHNALAWLLATCPEAKLRDPGRAVKLARKSVELAPKVGGSWNTLGVAYYRAGEEKEAVLALNKAVELHREATVVDLLFLAMAHHKLGNVDESRKCYDQAAAWLEKNGPALAKDPWQAEELRRFRDEAEEVLERKKK
jgi:tetratricopeptide (TPR) repeat protein